MAGGGKSSSNSSTSNETTTNNFDQRIAAADGGLAVGAGASVAINNTTPEAWKALDGLTKGATDLGATAGEISDGAFGFAKDVGKLSFDIVNENTERVLGFLETRSQSEETTLAQSALKIALPIALAAVVVGAFRGKVRL